VLKGPRFLQFEQEEDENPDFNSPDNSLFDNIVATSMVSELVEDESINRN
jgi:hypothetical protein